MYVTNRDVSQIADYRLTQSPCVYSKLLKSVTTLQTLSIYIHQTGWSCDCSTFLPRLNWTWRAFRVPSSCCWSVRLRFSRDNDFTSIPRSTASVVLGIRSLSSVNMVALEGNVSLKLSSSIKTITGETDVQHWMSSTFTPVGVPTTTKMFVISVSLPKKTSLYCPE